MISSEIIQIQATLNGLSWLYLLMLLCVSICVYRDIKCMAYVIITQKGHEFEEQGGMGGAGGRKEKEGNDITKF